MQNPLSWCRALLSRAGFLYLSPLTSASPLGRRESASTLFLLLAGVLGLAALTPMARAEQAGDFVYYSPNGTDITLTSYTGPGGAVVIPDTIAGLPVREIAGTFRYNAEITSVTIPASVTSIGDGAFSGCTGLTGVIIPAGVTSIGSSAFYGCTGLTGFTIPASVTSIGVAAFYGCTGLTSISIPASVASIGGAAFSSCTGLTGVTIPASVISVGDSAFSGCTGLTSVSIPVSVTSIGSFALAGCTGLTSVTIPASVTSIGSAAFAGCTALLNVEVAPGNTAYKSVGGVLFNAEATTLWNYPGGRTGPYTIPASVTSIGDFTFYGCTGLMGVFF